MICWRAGGRGEEGSEAARGCVGGGRREEGWPARESMGSRMSGARRQRAREERTKLVGDDSVKLDALAKLVRLAADDDRHGASAREHGDGRGSCSRVEGTVGEESGGSEEDKIGSGKDRGEGGEEGVGAGDGVRREREEEVLA